MRKITIICLGSLKEDFWKSAIKEYEKRLQKFCELEIVEIAEEKLPQNPSSQEIEKALEIESKKILEKAKGKKIFCFCVEEKPVSSEEFALLLEKSTNEGPICFVVGSSFGLAKSLKKQTSGISFGKITFPHQLFRVVLMEQIYRGFMILSGSTYHK